MLQKIRQFLKPALIPFTLALLNSAVVIISYYFPIVPSAESVAEFTQEQYARYGLIAVALAALIEGLFMIGLYFPGSFILVAAVIVAPNDPLTLASIGLVALVVFSFTNALNYALGRYGFYKMFLALGGEKQLKRIHKVFERWGTLALFITAAIPSYLSVTMICTGIARERLWKVWSVSVLSLTFWITVVTIAAAAVSSVLSASGTGGVIDWTITGVLLIWGIINIIRVRRMNGHASTTPEISTQPITQDTQVSDSSNTDELS